METTRLAKQHKPSFVKKRFAKHYETPSTHHSWCVPISLFRPGFGVVREVCSPLKEDQNAMDAGNTGVAFFVLTCRSSHTFKQHLMTHFPLTNSSRW